MPTETISLAQSTSGYGGGALIPPVSITGAGNIDPNLGGEIRKTFESGELAKVVFPSNSIKGTVVTKIEPQNKTEVIKTNPLPKNTQILGDLVADFKALSGGEKVTKFEKEVPITFTYSDEQVKSAGVDEITLKVYRWDKATKTWKPIKSQLNTLTNTIIASIDHFTLFTVMGETTKMTREEILTKMIEILKQLIQLYTQLIQGLKGLPR